ncbi:MAG: hypothetical protein JSV41_06410 [Gemmatimonadota bacterium]|nr:MAG: hypothetical protein JSV41_06410 [Gemmatimonadota bacterium]
MRRVTAQIPVLIAILTISWPGLGVAQDTPSDSIFVVERGAPGVDAWDVAEFPFKIATAPLYLLALGLGRAAGAADDIHLIEWVTYYNQRLNANYLYPGAGSLGSGSGFGAALLLGVPDDDRLVWGYVRGDVTYKQYWGVVARIGYGMEEFVPGDPRRFGIHAFGSIIHRDRDEFFGIGKESREQDKSDFELDRQAVGVELGLAPIRTIAIRVGLDWSTVESGPGNNPRLPDLDSIFDPAAVSRFGDEDRYLGIGVAGEWRSGYDRPLLGAGRWLRVGFRWNDSRSTGAADFTELEASAGVDLPFDYDRRSLALGVLFRSVRASGDGELPFYRLPALGGSSTAPAYLTSRFRDRDLILGRSEYFYRLWALSDEGMALIASVFLDGGMVAWDLIDDFAFKHLKPSYGIALSALAGAYGGGRIELAGGDEGFRVNLGFAMGQ